MKAILMDGYGGPEVLVEGETVKPVPEPGQALIRVKAIGVNPADFKWRLGMFQSFVPLTFPHIIGYDVAGLIETAPGSKLAAGTRVAVMLDNIRQQGYAEYAVVNAENLAVIPDAVSFETAAAIPTPGLTGAQLAEELLDAQPGQIVLITGATGSVGRFALHAAKRRGAYVIAAVRASQRDAAKALGADAVLTLGEEDWTGGPIARLGDTVGGEAVGALCRHVPADGRIVTAATTPIPKDGLLVEPAFQAVHSSGPGLTALLAAVAAGDIDVPIAQVLPLSQAAKAHALLEAGGLGGKIILTPSEAWRS